VLPDEVIARLKAAEGLLRSLGVASLYLFGSHARNEAGPDSDIDVFVHPVSSDRFGFLPFMRAHETIRQAIGPDREIGYSTREGLDRYVRADVEREAVRIF
jgi:predicted nucleotidyltransferase